MKNVPNPAATLTGDDAPMPRASDKQVKAARIKAALKVGKPKHVPTQADRINADVAKHQAAAKRKPKADQVIKAVESTEPKLAPPIPTTGYHGPMLTLRDRLKQGAYKKSANGQPSCGDQLATMLGALEPTEVIRACLIAMDIANPYTHLNSGQQSMNLRNKLRGKLKRNEFGYGVVAEAIEEVIEGRSTKMEEVIK